jgi:hypothetical protein
MRQILHTDKLIATAAASALAIGLAGAGVGATAAHAATNGGSALRPAAATQPTPNTRNWVCPGIGFTVMHNDRSGGVVLPKGSYRVASPELGCKTSSAYFTTFLNKYQGQIPGWTGNQLGKGYGTYTNNRTKQTFTVKYVGR